MSQIIWNPNIDVYNENLMPLTVAKNIAKYLSINDLILFSQISKNTNTAANDPSIWILKLKKMGVWNKMRNDKRGEIIFENDPLKCFDELTKSKLLVKKQVINIYTSLKTYYYDLLLNKPYEKLNIFKVFQSPKDQLKILYNLSTFNKIDNNHKNRVKIKEKLNSLFEIFENALLRELEIHYDIQDHEKTKIFIEFLLKLNKQLTIDFYLQKSIFDNEKLNVLNIDTVDTNDYFNLTKDYKDQDIYAINQEAFENLSKSLYEIFNYQSYVIDIVFPQNVSVMQKISVELISQLINFLTILIEESKKINLYLFFLPFIYNLLITNFIENLGQSKNMGSCYKDDIKKMIDNSFETFIIEYMEKELQYLKNISIEKILEWKNVVSKKQIETEESIRKTNKNESKNDFLLSFKKVFNINSEKTDCKSYDKPCYEDQIKSKFFSENTKLLKKILSPELILDTLNQSKMSLYRLRVFWDFSIPSIKSEICNVMQEIFVNIINVIGHEHLKPGFNKAILLLQTYNPKSSVYTVSHEETFTPLLKSFFELVNVGDLIVQMIDNFYKKEIVNKKVVKNENSIFNISLQNKKKLEILVDKYVAEGLNISIEVLFNDLENVFKSNLKEDAYNFMSTTDIDTNLPTKAAVEVVEILTESINLLQDCFDKSLNDIFQKEVAERFFQTIVKTIQNRIVSISGATLLITDLNYYFDFVDLKIISNKKYVLPLFQALKKIGSIYLINGSDKKAISKIVIDLAKFNGVFKQEDIYEFIQKRKDWNLIKKHVEKVMYGFAFGDCSIH